VPFFIVICISLATSSGAIIGTVASMAGTISFGAVGLDFLWLIPIALILGVVVATRFEPGTIFN